MSLKKIALTFLLTILINSTINAQIKYFFKTDIGLSSMRYRPAIAKGGRFGYALGAEALMTLKSSSVKLSSLDFNPSLSFVKTAYSIYVANAANSNIVAKYLRADLPVMQCLYAGGPSHEYYIGAGPFLALPVGGHFTEKSTRYKMRYGNTSASNRRGHDVGMVFKLSMTHFLNTNIRFSLQYNYGILNLVPKYYNPNNIKIRSSNFYLSFAFPIE